MKAMILAAGRGNRMRPLTDTVPKPLLKVNGKSLIEYHLEKLYLSGIKDVVINHAWLGEQIELSLGDGSRFGLNITFSPEPEGGLETAGGIIKALPLLGENPFLVISADVFCDINFSSLKLPEGSLAHLILVDNPGHNSTGDFSLLTNGLLKLKGDCLTYSGVGLFSPSLFANYPQGYLALREVFESAIMNNMISGEIHDGYWSDVGTPERLQKISKQFS